MGQQESLRGRKVLHSRRQGRRNKTAATAWPFCPSTFLFSLPPRKVAKASSGLGFNSHTGIVYSFVVTLARPAKFRGWYYLSSWPGALRRSRLIKRMGHPPPSLPPTFPTYSSMKHFLEKLLRFWPFLLPFLAYTYMKTYKRWNRACGDTKSNVVSMWHKPLFSDLYQRSVGYLMTQESMLYSSLWAPYSQKNSETIIKL